MLEASSSRLSLAFTFVVVIVAGVAVLFVLIGSHAHQCGVVCLPSSFMLGRGWLVELGEL